MRVLFMVFLLSLIALICTLIALRWHVRDHGAEPGEPLHLAGTLNEDSLKQNE